MNHLSQEELILRYYGELETEHLAECSECREELARLSSVLDQVNAIEVPDPGDDYETRVWGRLSWRLRGEQRKSRKAPKWLAAAAMILVAFVTGLLLNRNGNGDESGRATQVATRTPAAVTPVRTAETASTQTTSSNSKPGAGTQQQRDRILLVVVGDHFDESERVLVELTNLTPTGETDITTEQKRAEELLASNRLYRRSALDRGEENVATLLDELEPVLMQIAHAPSQVSANELRRMQKRVETKGLVFKLRVVRAGVRSEANLPPQPSI
ncbi:MAG TPA: hypothetical protein VF911_14610 [Thermoanaerobaculia bacterium]|jgi:hypothetical protein